MRDSIRAKREFWSPAGRLVVVALSASSIWSLLIEFFGWWSMRGFALVVFLPALLCLGALVVTDGMAGTRRLARAVIAGALAGLLAAVSYDIFRLPFVFSRSLGLEHFVPAMNLFKVFPQFGAMLLAKPLNQPHYSIGTQLLGWAYHFSNGLTFGIMYVALVGDPKTRQWPWGLLFAVGLELGMLFTPYPGFFQIPVTTRFVIVTLLAHGIFGTVMGLAAPVFVRRLPQGS